MKQALCALVFLLATQLGEEGVAQGVLWKGGDVSFIPQIEDRGGVYRDSGKVKDPLQIFADHGFNLIRLRLWHTPRDGYCGLERTLAMARRLRTKGFTFLLNFHYSDTWADPGKQYKPAAWSGLSFPALKDSVRQYTRRVVAALIAQGTRPDLVQIGNEITGGMLWNDGRVGGRYDTPQQWQNLAELIRAAEEGLRGAGPGADSIRVMIHIDRGGDNAGARWFFDRLLAQGVEFDVIGLSYYPWWHGNLSALQTNLNDLAIRYGKDIMVVETAYPWTLQGYDQVTNIVGSSSQLLPGYPASVEGQAAFLREVIRIVRSVPGGRGIGVCYWAPEYISIPQLGSPWENNALFDFQGNALSSMGVFGEELPQLEPVQVTLRLNTATLADTFRPHHVAQIRGSVSGYSVDRLPDGRKVTWDANSELILTNRGGDYWEVTFPMYPGDRLDFKFWTGFTLSRGTFQRLGWEGPVIPVGENTAGERVLVVGPRDTTLPLQFFNSSSEARPQYWRPYLIHPDSVTLYFRVNMLKAIEAGIFDPQRNGPLAVRGDSLPSGGKLSWSSSRLILQRELYSVASGSFWSGICVIPRSAVQVGDTLKYRFYIENAGEEGWEDLPANRKLVFTATLLARGDTTLHWDYFRPRTSSGVRQVAPCPLDFSLGEAYPNPFRQEVRISYQLKIPARVRVEVFDLAGRCVERFEEGWRGPGVHQIRWDGGRWPSGIYLFRISAGRDWAVRKVALLR
ncbi:MAG: glycosyl hydrolase 53 family protein [candidate division KSB1 bacterium]|nr:glycosyl hydrolase 53 family protein [candidate division KSB1 bacterium]